MILRRESGLLITQIDVAVRSKPLPEIVDGRVRAGLFPARAQQLTGGFEIIGATERVGAQRRGTRLDGRDRL